MPDRLIEFIDSLVEVGRFFGHRSRLQSHLWQMPWMLYYAMVRPKEM
jgi:hypothetical protein